VWKEMDKEKTTIRDSRAITDNFLKDLKEDLKFIPDTIRQDSELELCFRGNSGDCIVIYQHNHQLIKITRYERKTNGKDYKITLSLNHARYTKSMDDVYNQFKQYGMVNKDDCFPASGYLEVPFTKKELIDYGPKIIADMKNIVEDYFTKIETANEPKGKVMD
jgi:hypothetical protein